MAIRAFQHCPPAFRDEDHARAWLLALARNVCMDLHRERRRGREVSIDDEPLSEHRSDHDPEAAYLVEERDRHLRALVKRLPLRLRRTVELHVFGEMKYEDVARELGITVMNVRKRMQEVRQKMRDALSYGAPLDDITLEPNDIAEAESAQAIVTLQVSTLQHDERDVELVLPAETRADDVRIAQLERYCAKHPRGWRRRLDLARALASVGRIDEAISHYAYVVERQPYPIEHWREFGAVHEAQGNRTAAAAIYARGAKEAGREPARQHLHALAAALRGEIDDARETLTTLMDSDAGDARHAREHGAQCLAAGHPIEAVRALERAYTTDPSDPLTPSLLHDALIDAGRPLAALAHVAAAVELNPENIPALERYLDDRAPAGDVESALIVALLRLSPERARVHAVASRVAMMRGNESEAESRLLIYQLRHPRNAVAWRALADLHLATGQVKPALEAALLAQTFRPDDREIALDLCRILPISGDSDTCARFLKDVRPSHDALILGNASAVALAVENRSLALELCERALEIEPEIPSLRYRYALVLADASRYENALSELAEAWHLAPLDDGDADAGRVALLLARLHRRIGANDASHEWAKAAAARADALARIDPATAFALRGTAHELAGAMTNARSDYRAALQHHVLHPTRGQVLMALRRMEGDPY